MEKIFENAELASELTHNKAEITRLRQKGGPFLRIRSVKTNKNSYSYKYYRVCEYMESVWKQCPDDIWISSYVWFTKRDDNFQRYRCRLDKLIPHEDHGAFDVDIMDIEKHNIKN